MKTFLKCMLPDILRVLLFPLHVLPVKQNRLLFTGLTGGTFCEYSGNPRYLCEYIQRHYAGKYEIVWAVGKPENYAYLRKKGVRLVKHFSPASFPYLLTARVVVTNGSYAPWFPFRKGQYVINTWHGGGAYKKIENSRADAGWAAARRARFCAHNISLFVSTCKMATEKIIRGAFGYQGEVLEAGMPRNDFLVKQDRKAAEQKVRKRYGIAPQEKIVLYAPTYRKNRQEVVLDADRLLAFLERDGSKWHFLCRMHRYHEADDRLRVVGARIEDAGSYPEMQELLAAADMMITDYSSNIWDYSFLRRPCFLYTPDLQEYLQTVGFYVDIHEWPFAICMTQEELEEKIGSFDACENDRRIEEHYRFMGCAETGKACALLAERIAGVCGL